MKIKIVEDAKIIISNPDNMHNYFGWPTVARLPDGVLATVCSGYRLRHVDPFGKCVISYSRNNGRSWSRPAILIDTPYDDRDGGIAVLPDGKVIVTSFVCRPQNQKNILDYYEKNVVGEDKVNAYVKSYLDLVETPQMLKKYFGSTFVLSEDGGYTFGNIQHSPVTNPHGPLALPDGGLLFIGNKMPDYERINSVEKEPICCYRYTIDGEFEFLSEIEYIPNHPIYYIIKMITLARIERRVNTFLCVVFYAFLYIFVKILSFASLFASCNTSYFCERL